MIWSETLGLVYYPVPKSACTSAKLAILKSLNLNTTLETVHSMLPSEGMLRIEPSGITCNCPLPDDKKLTSFAIVRYPLSRLVSCYINKVKNRSPKLKIDISNIHNMNQFIDAIEKDPFADPHFAPQYSLIPEKLDFILHLETINENWTKLSEVINSELPLFPIAGETKHDPWESYYDEDNRLKVEKIYQKDLELYYSENSPRNFINCS